MTDCLNYRLLNNTIDQSVSFTIRIDTTCSQSTIVLTPAMETLYEIYYNYHVETYLFQNMHLCLLISQQ